MQCCHNDGNPANNRVENLRWDTVSSNANDRVRHGRHGGGNQGKLKARHVRKIFEWKQSGMTQAAIAKRLGVGVTSVWSVLNQRSHIQVIPAEFKRDVPDRKIQVSYVFPEELIREIEARASAAGISNSRMVERLLHRGLSAMKADRSNQATAG